jgi:predicted permease
MIRLLSLLIPAAYRADVLGDLRERHRGAALLGAIVRSALDARRARRQPRDRWMSGLGPDLRGAWRHLAARPGASLSLVTILALAMALNTAVAAVGYAVLYRPLPFPDLDRLVFVWNTSPVSPMETLTPARALDLRAQVGAFEAAALIGHMSFTVSDRGPAQRWFGSSVSSSFFDVVGASARLGRTFHAAEPDRDVIVLSHRLWIEQFGGDPGVIGDRVVMNGRPRTILGVMGRDFYWPSITSETTADNPPLFWTCAPPHDVPERPMAFDEDITRNRTMGYLRMVARVTPVASVAEASREASAVAVRLGAEYPLTDEGRGVRLVDPHTQLFGSVSSPLRMIFAASALVVLAACINVGCLLLVRQSSRQREFAVRTAIGAGRARIIRSLTLEACLVSSAAGVAGVLGAMGVVRVIIRMAPPTVGRLDDVSLSWPILVVAGGVVLMVSLVLGVLSGLVFWRDRAAYDLRTQGSASAGRSRTRHALVALECALAMTLLTGAALFARSLVTLQQVDVGLNADRLLTFDMQLTGERAEYQREQLDFYDHIFERLRALPGVAAASGALTLPIGGDDFGAGAFPEGRPMPPPGESVRVGFQLVWDRWFDTLGMHITRGRDFAESDTTSAPPVAMINERLAHQLWPGEDPLGRRLKYARQDDAPWLTVVGVVSDVRHHGPGEPIRPEIYLPYRQMTQGMMAVAIRTTGDPMALAADVRAAVAAVDPTQPISGIDTMAQHLDRTFGRARFLSQLTLAFGLSACVLTVIGIFGVTSYTVSQRTREFGVRSALGASPSVMLREVMRQSLAPVFTGLGAGVLVAAWTGRMAAPLLHEVEWSAPGPYVTAAVVLGVTATVAVLLPARRASRVNPAIALRG